MRLRPPIRPCMRERQQPKTRDKRPRSGDGLFSNVTYAECTFTERTGQTSPFMMVSSFNNECSRGMEVEQCSGLYLDNFGQDIEEAEDVVAHEVVVTVVVLVLPRQEERLAELTRVHVRDRDRARHHQQNTACHCSARAHPPYPHSDFAPKVLGRFPSSRTADNNWAYIGPLNRLHVKCMMYVRP